MKFILLILLIAIWTLSSEACHCNTEKYAPVCASNGKTWRNMCQFICANRNAPGPAMPAQVLYEGDCVWEKPCFCPSYQAPVCASDGENWVNECVVGCAKKYAEGIFEDRKNLTVKMTGQCGYQCDCTGNDEEDLICGSDTVTYKNQCVFDCVVYSPYGQFRELTKKHSGACEN